MKITHAASIHRDRDELIRLPLPTFSLHDVLSDEEIRRIEQWTDAWLEVAMELGFVRWPYVIDSAMVADIQSCYRMKMAPEEAVLFCYRMHGESRLF
ncbi:hypothetical protein GXB81_15900 [Paraburkholderia sp. Ac-20336]|uniref:hypothetical protein n=1 Tax=Paraburkholderia sp. Ac-20336 TaxID=2703886 RepID=UPI00197CEA0A|nr:hypothetical protein [Paraburkholderia sp. Ac-20336]MBN3804520.1 hypothetical protein [Paraburkholderia sp. Ac-20336]